MKAKKEKVKKENGMSVADTIKSIRSKFGEDSIMKLDQKPIVGIDSISTGSFGLDHALGIGGLPRGRIIEVFGPESSGKTTLALHTIAEAQKKGGLCAFIDAEHALDPEYAKRLGVKTNDLLVSQPQSGEQALEILESMIRSKKFATVVIDSVATLTPKDEIEGEMGAQHVGRHARLMSHAMRKLVGIIHESNTVVLFINQIRISIGQAYGNPEFTPGGKALKFYSSVRLEIRKIATIKKGEDPVGSRVRVKVVKNKVAPPFKQTEFDLMFNEGISREGEILALGEKFKIISKSGNSYSYGSEKLGRGYDASRQFLKANLKLRDTIIGKIKAKLNEVVDPVEAEIETNDTLREENTTEVES